MLDRVLSARIRDYAPANSVEQENVLQELMQHYVLSSLSRAGLFAEAMFRGGTCLRIVYGMNRFSEDSHQAGDRHQSPLRLDVHDQLHHVPRDGADDDAVPGIGFRPETARLALPFLRQRPRLV